MPYGGKGADWLYHQKWTIGSVCSGPVFANRDSQEARDLQGFLGIDCNGHMKFFCAHCGRR
jgi:hypothetical protein